MFILFKVLEPCGLRQGLALIESFLKVVIQGEVVLQLEDPVALIQPVGEVEGVAGFHRPVIDRVIDIVRNQPIGGVIGAKIGKGGAVPVGQTMGPRFKSRALGKGHRASLLRPKIYISAGFFGALLGGLIIVPGPQETGNSLGLVCFVG